MKIKHGMCLVAVMASILLGAAGAWARTQPTSISISPQDPTVVHPATQQFTALSKQLLQLGEIRALSNGEKFTCALLADGTAKCWGRNQYGQLGNGSTADSKKPVTVSGLTDAVAIAAGWNHTCAVLKNGTAECWGGNQYGQLGDGSKAERSKPVLVKDLTNAVAIAAGGNHTCAVLANGTAKCWGRNNQAELGLGYDKWGQERTGNKTSPTPVHNLARAVAITVGAGFSCALNASGRVYCWGADKDGQLGPKYHSYSCGLQATPLLVKSLSKVVSIASGRHHTCAVQADGRVKCWGEPGADCSDGDFPQTVENVQNAVAVSSEESFESCAVVSDGTVSCWTIKGETSTLGFDFKIVGADVTGLDLPVAAIAGGGNHTCAVLANGTAKCWGQNDYGQLGNGTTSTTPSTTPVTVSADKQLPGNGVIEVAGGESHTCALLADGTVQCWGWNKYGQVGAGTDDTYYDHPTKVISGPNNSTALSNVVKIAAGNNHTCALLANGTVKCWGRNNKGQLGKSDGNSNAPVNVVTGDGNPLTNVAAIAAGGPHTCARQADGHVWCWGSDYYGELGDGPNGASNTNNRSSTLPVEVIIDSRTPPTPLGGVTAIAAGQSHTCARLGGGTAECWGLDNYGQVGTNVGSYTSTPVKVISDPSSNPATELSNVVKIAAGKYHTCTRLGDGTIKCWGNNNDGQLGNPDAKTYGHPFSYTPVEVKDLTDAVVVSAGGNHTCAVLGDRKARCWGDNRHGELGDGTGDTSSDTPRNVKEKDVSGQTHDLTSAAAIAAGGYHTCALQADGTVKCWGRNNQGQLGNGTIVQQNTAVPTKALVNSLAWSSSSPTVAKIDASGLATTRKAGTTTITATFGGLSPSTDLTASTTLTVKK